MSGQFGAGKMGGVALSAGGTVSQDFRNVPKGAISRLMLTVSMGLKSSAGAFAAVVGTGGSATSEGTDDIDLLMNACFSLLALYWDASTLAFALTPAQLRTVFGLLNQRDLDGTLVNGSSVPTSAGAATTYKIVLPIPVSLDTYFEDGGLFANGSHRLSEGRLDYTCTSSLTPSVVLANGTAVVSGLSVSIDAETGAGTEADVGMTWSVKRLANLPTSYELDDALRLAILDTTPVNTNAASSYNVAEYELQAPSTLGAFYQAQRLRSGGYDITARCTPLDWIRQSTKFLDLNGRLNRRNKLEAVSGVSSLTVYDIQAKPAPATAVQSVSQKVGAGGPVTIVHPSPASLPPGTQVPAHLATFLPSRISPGAQAGGNVANSPEHAAQRTIQNQASTAKARGVLGLFKR
jgi:hypothetical protein